MDNQLDLVAHIALQAWDTNLKRMTSLFDALSDEEMMGEIAPGKNRAVYVLGHMAAVHDRMIELLGLGERKLAHLDNAFLANADKVVAELPSVAELRSAYTEANSTLNSKFTTLSGAEWLQKHNAVSEEDFAKEPHRNRLGVLLSRTNHVSYHLGQLIYLKK